MKRNLKLSLGALLISGAWIFSSCQKDGMNNQSQDITSVTDEAKISSESAKMDDIINIVAYDNVSTRGLFDQLPSCATVTYDTLSTPKSVTVDFGSTPCLSDWDSKYRTGIIKITWTGPMKEPGTVKTITTDNYFVGSVAEQLDKLELTKTITNMGLNSNGNLVFAISVPNATLTLFEGGTVTWTAAHEREWTVGFSTPDPNDDVFMITGGSSGTDRNGLPFTVEITEPLMKDACPWIVSGLKSIKHGDLPDRIIDYGNGDCDDIAIVKVNGEERTIHLQ